MEKLKIFHSMEIKKYPVNNMETSDFHNFQTKYKFPSCGLIWKLLVNFMFLVWKFIEDSPEIFKTTWKYTGNSGSRIKVSLEIPCKFMN